MKFNFKIAVLIDLLKNLLIFIENLQFDIALGFYSKEN
jgi:hypothetical protein